MALKPRSIFNRGSFRNCTLNVKHTLLTQFCMFVLHLKEKWALKKNHHLFKPQTVFTPTSPMSPVPDLLPKADFSPTSQISMFKTCSILTRKKKKATLNRKPFESSLTFEAFVFFNPCSANFVSLSPPPLQWKFSTLYKPGSLQKIDFP